MALLVAAADGLQETYLKRVKTYNHLIGLLSDMIDRLVAEDPAAGLKDLMYHPHPEVFKSAAARYYWNIDENVAEAMVKAIAEANPDSTPLGKQARQTLRAFESNRKFGNTPSARAAAGQSKPYVPPPQEPPVLRTVDRKQLEAIAAEVGCEPLVPLAWPSLRLKRTHLDADGLPIGASKLGGSPDMPTTEEWPRFRSNPLSFIAQINLSAIAQYREFTHLPESGHLLFFYDTDLQPWGHEDLEPGSSRVLYVEPGSPLVRRMAPADLYEELQYRPASLEFFVDMTLPGYDIGPMSEDPDEELPDLSDEQVDELGRLREAVSAYQSGDNQPKHRMFGFSDGWQDSMHIRWEYERGWEATPYDRFRMLLQVDSDEEQTEAGSKGMYWGSGGRIHYWANRSDLEQCDFENVQLILQCT
ncbi:hypothetical protein D3C72_645400 [compost metagenome]